MQKSFPQLVRIDWMTVGDGELTVRRVAEENKLGGASVGLTVPAAPMRLARIAIGGKVTMIPDTDEINTPDFQLMKRRFASSLHVPGVRHGQTGVISFWSGEKNGFPPEAVTLLEALAGRLSVDTE